MDPLIILVASIFIILLASFIVNFYYIHGHYLHQTDYTTSTTQTVKNFSTDVETQTNNQKPPVGIHDQSIQNVQTVKTVGAGNSTPVQVEHCVQTDKVCYVSLPEQLDQILKQLKTNLANLNHCMEWVGECEKLLLLQHKQLTNSHRLFVIFMKLSKPMCARNYNTNALTFYRMCNSN